jgi:hypothetical protein
MQPPRAGTRYGDYRLPSDTPKPELPGHVPPEPFRVDPQDAQPITQRAGYIAEDATPSEAKPNSASAANTSDVPPAPAKPWLPLTATLLCLFGSLGANAYMGLQWWSVRLRCQQLLQDRREAATFLDNAAEDDLDEDQPDDEDEEDEDQDVRAISDDELARGRRRS